MDENNTWDLLFGDLATAQMSKVRESITSLSVSYSSSMCTQLTIELIDPGFDMLENNYFIIGRDIVYKSKVFPTPSGDFQIQLADKYGYMVHLFEIASVEVRPSSGSSPSISVQARTKAVQQMKRDKNPSSIKGKSSDYVYFAALQYGLTPLLEKTSKSRQINKASGDRQADSTWDVLSNLAGDAKFMLFETDGLLFFCSMDFLMGKWGVTQIKHNSFYDSKNQLMPGTLNVIPLLWPPVDAELRKKLFFKDKDVQLQLAGTVVDNDTKRNAGVLIPLSMPVLRRSDNDPFVVSGSASVDRSSGTFLRPGMTLLLGGIPTFEDIYMITGVNFDHFSTNPVSIEFSRPEREGKYIQTFAVGPVFADYGNITENSPLISKLRVV